MARVETRNNENELGKKDTRKTRLGNVKTFNDILQSQCNPECFTTLSKKGKEEKDEYNKGNKLMT